MTATLADRTGDAEWLALRIGATTEAIARLAADVLEDEKTLEQFHRGTPPDGSGFGAEDECAAFVTDAIDALTRMHAELEGLRERRAALEAQAIKAAQGSAESGGQAR